MTKASPSGQRKRLLFVCVENCCRSQMAEAFARMIAGDRIDVRSAGSRPSGRVHPKAVAVMAERGYNLEQHHSKGLDEIPALEFDVVVTIGCGDICSRVFAHRYEDWDVPAPKDMPIEQFRAVRDVIEDKVKALVPGIA